MDPYLKSYNELNDRQKEAVDTTEGPILVLAGPGTGKTQLLSVRAGSIIKKGAARPENILILTYTNSAAKAMKERLARVVGPAGYDVEVGTFHSFANSIIQESAEAANYVGDRIPMSDVEQAKAVEYALDNSGGVEEIRPFRSPYAYLKEVQRKIGDMKKDDIKPADLQRYLDDPKSSCHQMEERYIKRLRALSVVYRRYEELKKGSDKAIFDERGRYDFDDMILFAVDALTNEPGLLEDCRRQYTYIMVDEFQDTNGAQMDLLFTLMARDNPNLCCVGDDDQSIYRFQGASVANFRSLKKRFPGIKTIQLAENYRSTEDLIKVSRAIIHNIPGAERIGEKELKNVKDYAGKEIVFRELTTEEEELLYIVDKVKELKKTIEKDPDLSVDERKYPYNNIAVLVRKRNQVLKVIDAFLQAGIPYATDGKEDMGGEKRVRQLLDSLELAHIDPKDCESKDLSLYKVITADYFRIPPADMLRFIHYVNQKKGKDPNATILSELLELSPEKIDAARLDHPERLQHASGVIKTLIAEAGSMPVHKILMDFIKASGLFTYVLDEYSGKGALRIRQLRGMGSFVNMVKASDMANPAIRLDEFLAEMRTRKNHGLPVQGDLVTLTQEGVRIYTAHGSKGLEFHSVIIPFCLQDKSWPVRPMAEKIQLPLDLFKTRRDSGEKEMAKKLAFQDETRLFYVATTRARANLIFTASPSESAVPTSYLNTLEIKKELSAGRAASEEAVIGKSLETTDKEDPLIGTDAVLADIVSNLTLNPTRLNNYISCRRKFMYNDVLKLPGQKKKSLVFGNCVHKALEETYRAYKDTGKFPPFDLFEREFTRELRFQGADNAMERDCLNRMKTLRGWFDNARKNAVIPIDLEKKLMITVGDNIIFTGKYDKVEWDDERTKTVRIVDYKTGKPDDHIKAIDKCGDLASADCEGYLRQLVAYKLLFEKDRKASAGRTASCGALVFIEPVSADMKRLGYKKGDYATKTVTITEAMVKELEEVIKRVWNDIKALRFEKLEARDEDTCRNCDFDSICWG